MTKRHQTRGGENDEHQENERRDHAWHKRPAIKPRLPEGPYDGSRKDQRIHPCSCSPATREQVSRDDKPHTRERVICRTADSDEPDASGDQNHAYKPDGHPKRDSRPVAGRRPIRSVFNHFYDTSDLQS
ncbi:hypothetical protein OHAE_5249 [Ochrobactrum soli]|uniref:Uncharacterized protein n=1 Tax=Ochrobactrum soli TaxID=2448455 RepID=A0A2P9HEW1_9HYPH|nr:hypothetical protein OHAE_5249 [[Ochrobactrum] soli]